MHFKARAGRRLADERLQQNLKKLSTKFVSGRASAITELDDFEGTRNAAKERRMRAIENLDVWLDTFEQQAVKRGATVLYAQTAEEASRLVVEIAKKHDVKKATKTKSMVSEEMELNKALEAAGVQTIETDLGEYILQINGNEAPSHIIAPVVHKDKEEISDLFARVHKRPRLTDIPQMTREAREILRPQFLSADMGITGGNFIIAETGSVAIVTNEGNEGMCTILPPKVHVVVTGIEKVLPTLEDFATVMRLLPRSATGQSISNYVDVLTGIRGDGEFHGARHMYFILVDAGRSAVLGSEVGAALRCIRCGACMNHCPVYQNIGGHSYGWVYPGPIGSILTPSYIGLEKALDLPQASTLCNQCGVVCPVKIPLPDLLRKLREQQFARRLRPWAERAGLRAWSWLALRPRLFGALSRIGVRALRRLGGRDRLIHRLPLGRGWTDGRDMPAPAGRTFRDLYAQRRVEGERR